MTRRWGPVWELHLRGCSSAAIASRHRGESPSSTDPKSFPTTFRSTATATRRHNPPKPMLLRVLALAGVAAARPSACETPTEVEAGATFGITPAVGKETYDDGKTACWVLRADKSVTIGSLNRIRPTAAGIVIKKTSFNACTNVFFNSSYSRVAACRERLGNTAVEAATANMPRGN